MEKYKLIKCLCKYYHYIVYKLVWIYFLTIIVLYIAGINYPAYVDLLFFLLLGIWWGSIIPEKLLKDIRRHK